MNLNHSKICAEFLGHFLTVIQNEAEKNAATFFSGFLRATKLSRLIAKLNDNSHFIPLSSVLIAGLVDEHFNFTIESEQAKRIGFSFDRVRTQDALTALGVDITQINEVQQLVLITCCQEAVNRVLTGDFRVFAENTGSISDEQMQQQILRIMHHLSAMSFNQLIRHVRFNPGSTMLSPEFILLIQQHYQKYLEAAEDDAGIDIPDEELIITGGPAKPGLSPKILIAIYDELTPNLIINSHKLPAEIKQEHEAKLFLLKLHCKILYETLNNNWKVGPQWIRPGLQISIGEQEIALPYSISQIVDVIEQALACKHGTNYFSALNTIKTIATNYEKDWYTWGRNTFSFYPSAPEVPQFLKELRENIELIQSDTSYILVDPDPHRCLNSSPYSI